MNKQELEALQRVILYIILSEAKHYEECEPKEKKQHIYKEIMKIAKWLDRQKGFK